MLSFFPSYSAALGGGLAGAKGAGAVLGGLCWLLEVVYSAAATSSRYVDEAGGGQVTSLVYGYGSIFCVFCGGEYYGQLASLLRYYFRFRAILYLLSYLEYYSSRTCVVLFWRSDLFGFRYGIRSDLSSGY